MASSFLMKEWCGIFFNGLWMDASVTGYILLLSSLVTGVFYFSPPITRIVFKWLTLIMLFVLVFITVTDLELYRHWSFRIDATPLFYLETPAEAMASQNVSTTIFLILMGTLLFAGFYWLFRMLVQKIEFKPVKFYQTLVFLLISGVAIIPIRGGFGIAPMNPAKVYFSHHVFSNHAALNPAWNFFYGLLNAGDSNKKYPDIIPHETAVKTFGLMMEEKSRAPLILNCEHPNIVLILLEGFTSKIIERAGGVPNAAPGFNLLANDGLFFSNMYASGDRSNKGLVAILSGFPAQSHQAIIKNTVKVSKLPTLTNSLAELGYHSAFYYGGDPSFSNMQAYLTNSGFQRMVTEKDFTGSEIKSKWGVHDEYVFSRLLEEMDTARAPFFKMIFTLSSHEPFDIPEDFDYPVKTEEEKFIKSIQYTDHWLVWFFENVKQKPVYQNTLFVLIADHGHRYPGNSLYFSPQKYSIPMLWIGGVLEKTGTIDQIGSQTDLPQTLLYQLSTDAQEFRFSRNLLGSYDTPFAYYAFNDGFGFITPEGTFIWDHVGKQLMTLPSGDFTEKQAFSFFAVYQKYFLGL